MLRWVPYAFVRISLFFVLGILSAIYLGPYLSLQNAAFIIAGASLVYLISKVFLLKKYFFSLSWIQGVSAFAILFLLGYSNLILNKESLEENHLLHAEEVEYYKGYIDSPSEEKPNTHKYDFVVEAVKTDSNWQKAHGRIYLYIKKDSTTLSYGDQLLVKGNPDEISEPMNPGEFNYKRFLSFNNVYHQDYLTYNFSVIGHEVPNPILKRAYELRAKASSILTTYLGDSRENNIAQALVLGVKDGLDREIEHAYSASGAMHVLAVSGLHVGIIYGIILLFFKPFRKTKVRNWLLAIFSLIILWSYALVTGFSPSVLRAVTMFSFIAVAQASGRNTNIYNTLAASGFILLLFDPYLIMSVGFQLSFLAVFGIVYIQPRLYNAIEVDNYWLDQVWAITAVSIAAQIATIPLTLLYFHQFPTFFLVSNLAVIPGAFVILCSGLLLLFVSPFPALAELVGWLMQKLIYIVNFIVFEISEIPYSQITDIEITTLQAWFIIGCILCILFLFRLKKLEYLIYTAVLASSFALVEFTQTLEAKRQNKITIYRVNKHTAIDFTKGTKSHLFTDSVFRNDSEGLMFHVRPNRLYSGIVDHSFLNEENVPFIRTVRHGMRLVHWYNLDILILNDLGRKRLKLKEQLPVDYVLVASDFNKKVEWIDNNLTFEKIILDGSLNWYDAKNLKSELDSMDVGYYSVYHDGAMEIDLNN